MALINNSVKLGKGDTNLVLETAGHVYIKVADRFYELDFKNENKGTSTTIINNSVEAPEVDLSGYVSKKYLKSALNNYITVRNWNDVKQTQSMLENALLDGFTESINPITVQTMQLIVGTESLQFDFTDALVDLNNANGDIKFKPNVIGGRFLLLDGDILDCPESYILHYTLDGPSSVQPNPLIYYYARWRVGATKFTLEDSNSPYYVYIKAPKYNVTDADVDNGIKEDPIQDLRGSGDAEFVVSKEAIKLDAAEGYYYLLSALITDKSDGSRSIAYTNGFTEILPGQITAYIFKSGDGVQLMDFLNRQFHIGYAAEEGELVRPTDDDTPEEADDGSYMHWDPYNGLVIKGKITVTGGDLADALENLQKQIDDEIQAWFSDDPDNSNQEGHKHDIPSITSWPANTWYDDDATIPPDAVNPTRKKEHIGDLFYIIEGTYAGYVYRFVKQNGTYCWVEVSDNALAEALRLAHEALITANIITEYVNQSLSDGVLTQDEYTKWELYRETLKNNYDSLTGYYEDLIDQAITLRDSIGDQDDPLYQALDEAINALEDSSEGYYTLLENTYNTILDYIQDIFDEGVTPAGTINSNLPEIAENLADAMEIYGGLIPNFQNALQFLNNEIIRVNSIISLGTYEYLKAAIKDGKTETIGGLLLTSLLYLKDINTEHPEHNGEVSAGFNAIRDNDLWYNHGTEENPNWLSHAIGIWLGGSFTDKEYFYDYVAYDSNGDPIDLDDPNPPVIDHYEWKPKTDSHGDPITPDSNIPTAVLRHDGTGYFADGNIVWNIDGSGSIAGGKIWWDADGNVSVPGLIYYKDSQNNWFTDLDLNVQIDDPTNPGNKVTLREVILGLFGMFSLENVGSEEEPDWVIKAHYGLYSDDFISAGGRGSSSGDGGGSGETDMSLIWGTLTNNPNFDYDLEYSANTRIDKRHIPLCVEYLGTTSSGITNGSTTSSIIINNQSHTAVYGDLVTSGNSDFLWTGSAWKILSGSGSGGGEATNAVLYVAQSLADAQKIQARTNIGAGTGTVTSVGITVPTGMTVSDSPITASGNIVIGIASTHYLPTTNDRDSWNAWSNIFGIDDYGNVYLQPNNGNPRGFYTTGFITAGGQGSSGSGGGGVDMERVWQDLTNNISFDYGNYSSNTTIDINHIPSIPTTKITGLDSVISSCIKYIGITTTEVTDGGIQTPTIDGQGYTPVYGDMVIYNGENFLWLSTSWKKIGNKGTVTSIGMSVPTGLLINNASSLQTITTSGDFAVTLATGYTIPLSDDVDKGVSAYSFISDIFGIDADGNLYLKSNNGNPRGFYTDGFITAGGSGSSGGGGGVDISQIWASLQNTSSDTTYNNTEIHLNHIPNITTTKVTGLDNTLNLCVKYRGTTTTAITDGSTANPISISGQNYTAVFADMVTYSDDEYIFINNIWNKISGGSSGSGGITMVEVWRSLTNNASLNTYSNTTKIDVNHIPSITTSKISNLSSWTGSSAITTVGTITSGYWNGTAIPVSKGGTGRTSFSEPYAVLVMSSSDDIGYVGNNTSSTKKYLSQTGSGGAATVPVWSEITLSAATSSAIGGFKTGYSATGKNYAVQLDSNNKAYVNVPWTDNNDNTTYKLTVNGTTNGDSTNGVNLGSIYGPTSAGSSNQVLVSGGSGAPSWSSSLQLGGTLTVGSSSSKKTTTLNGQLSVSDAATLSSTLSVSGNTTIGGTLTVGTTSSTKNTTLNGALSVTGTSTLSGNTTIGGTLTVGSTGTNKDTYLYGKLYLRKTTASNYYLEYDSSKTAMHTNAGFYADSFITAGSVSSSSDERLKKNLRDVTLSLSQIAAAPAVEFDWTDGEGKGAGSIAQYWESLLPYNVHKINNTLSMEYGNIALISAITIAKSVEDQKNRIIQLEKEIRELRQKISYVSQ